MGRPTKALADRWVTVAMYMPPDRPKAYAVAADLARAEGLPNAENRSQWMRGACDMRMGAESRDRERLARKAVG